MMAAFARHVIQHQVILMKIEADDRFLVIDSKPWITGLIFIGAMIALAIAGIATYLEGEHLAGLGLGIGGTAFVGIFFAVFVRRNQLIIDRDAGEIILRRRTVLGYREVRHALEHLHRADVETNRGSEGSHTHRMVLMLDGGMDPGPHPFTTVYSSGRGAWRASKAVNDWLERIGHRR